MHRAVLVATLLLLGTLAVGGPVVGTASACADETSCPPPSGPLDPRYLVCNVLEHTPYHCLKPV